jgi:hypothetical protein
MPRPDRRRFVLETLALHPPFGQFAAELEVVISQDRARRPATIAAP